MAVGGIGASSATHLSQLQTRQVTTLGQMSSGQRITRAGIDPAGAAIVAELDTETASQRAAIRNANDGMSVLETAEGAAGSTVDALQRIRELAMQASSGTINDSQRSLMQREVDELVEQINAQADSTEFNGLKLADGSNATIDVQTGTGSDDQTAVNLIDLRSSTLGIDGIDLSSAAGAQSALDTVDGALDQVNSGRSKLGASHNRLASAVAYGEQAALNTEAASSTIGDTDFIQAFIERSNQSVQQEANIFAIAQSRNMNRVAVLGLLG